MLNLVRRTLKCSNNNNMSRLLRYQQSVSVRSISIQYQSLHGAQSQSQTTNTILMVPPNEFTGFNEEAAQDNKFMDNSTIEQFSYEQCKLQFENMVNNLQSHNINVIVAEKGSENTPDCIFPNNWISTHTHHQTQTPTICLYPMKVPNRRLEVRSDVIQQLKKQSESKNLNLNQNESQSLSMQIYDLTALVEDEMYFEGTGVLVLDHEYRIAYINISTRANPTIAAHWCAYFGFQPVLFEAKDENDNNIYHTNVLMSVGSSYVIICLDSIQSQFQRQLIEQQILATNKTIIDISLDQMAQFCGNVLELGSNENGRILAMSERAYQAFTAQQKQALIEEHGLTLVPTEIDSIERIFGGGIRCMIAELF